MGHSLNAFLLKGAFDEGRAREFDLRYRAMPYDLTMFFVIDRYVDAWAERLNITGAHAEPIYNFHVIHHMMNAIADRPMFAAISTDYFGGVGSQRAAVYRGAETLRERCSINEALRMLGVPRRDADDEFDTLGLGAFRSTYDFFGEGYDD
jgi:hypothetical protein